MKAKFDYSLPFPEINFREQPHYYRVGKGEQGVLLVEPYKSELLPHWRFRTPQIAEQSSRTIYEMFLKYKENGDFIGMDMSRKFLQMGYTRSRRYANHKSGQKYVGPVPADKKGQSGAHGRTIRARDVDNEKAEAAAIFYEKWQWAKEDPDYRLLMEQHRKRYEEQHDDDNNLKPGTSEKR